MQSYILKLFYIFLNSETKNISLVIYFKKYKKYIYISKMEKHFSKYNKIIFSNFKTSCEKQ